MQKIAIKGVDRDIYREILPSGLDLILIPNDKNTKKKNYYINFGVYYGALNNDFIPYQQKKMRSFPAGIAHFLEHKMFEMKEADSPFNFYSESGSYVNAYTSYHSTCYVVSGSKKITENLKYLFKILKEPYFTKENVEKEQGIITEEIHMREDDPDYIVMKMLQRNLYVKSSYRIPVIGSSESIRQINADTLYTCYQTFYRPSNMFLVVAGCIDTKEIYQLVCDELRETNFSPSPQKKVYHEPVKVGRAYEEMAFDTKVEKLAIGYKMRRSNFSIKDNVMLNLYLNMLIAINFSNTSAFSEKMRTEHLALRSNYMIQTEEDIKSFIIEIDTLQSDQFIEALEEQLHHLTATEEDMERMKKVWISSEVIKSDYADALLDSFVDDLVIYHDIVTNYVDLIRSMNMKTMKKVMEELDFSNRSIAKLTPIKK